MSRDHLQRFSPIGSCIRGGTFFVVTRLHPDVRQIETVLTLRAEDLVGAEVLEDGVRISYVQGAVSSPSDAWLIDL
jgi:hypothetical protein